MKQYQNSPAYQQYIIAKEKGNILLTDFQTRQIWLRRTCSSVLKANDFFKNFAL